MQQSPSAAGFQPAQTISHYRSALMGFAMLWIMLFRADQLHFSNVFLEFIQRFGFLGVDIFILLSGVGLGASLLKQQEPVPLNSFYAGLFRRILPTYWIIAAPYSLALVLAGRIPVSTALLNLSAFQCWFHIPDSFDWYVSALLGFCLLAPFYVRLFARCKYKRLLSAASFPLSCLLSRLAILLGVPHLQDFLFRIPPFALGVLLGWFLVTERLFTRNDWAYAGALGAVGLTLGGLMAAQYLYIDPCYIWNLLILPVCVWRASMVHLRGELELTSVLAAIGERSLEIYLLNVIITREYPTLTTWLGLSAWSPGRVYLVLYALNFAAAFALHALISRLQLLSDARQKPA